MLDTAHGQSKQHEPLDFAAQKRHGQEGADNGDGDGQADDHGHTQAPQEEEQHQHR